MLYFKEEKSMGKRMLASIRSIRRTCKGKKEKKVELAKADAYIPSKR